MLKIQIFNFSWNEMQRATIPSCWQKSNVPLRDTSLSNWPQSPPLLYATHYFTDCPLWSFEQKILPAFVPVSLSEYKLGTIILFGSLM